MARGVRFGRPRKIDVEALPGLRAQGLNARQIAGVSHILQALREHGP